MLGTVQICKEKISNLEAQDLVLALECNTLRLLSLRQCKVSDHSLERLLKSVGKCKTVLQLSLNVGMINNLDRVRMLSHGLDQNRSLTALHLHGSSLGESGMKALYQSVSCHPNIVSLDIGDCGLTDNCIPYISRLLPAYGAKRGLQEFTVSANQGVSSLGWAKFFVALAAGNSLRTLLMDFNRIGDLGAGCLASALAASHAIEHVDLENTAITENGAQVLLHLVKTFPVSLNKLVLSENAIREITIEAIDKALNHIESEDDSTDTDSEGTDTEADIETGPPLPTRKMLTSDRAPDFAKSNIYRASPIKLTPDMVAMATAVAGSEDPEDTGESVGSEDDVEEGGDENEEGSNIGSFLSEIEVKQLQYKNTPRGQPQGEYLSMGMSELGVPIPNEAPSAIQYRQPGVYQDLL